MEQAEAMRTENAVVPKYRSAPWLGPTLEVQRDPLGFLFKVAQQHGDVAQIDFIGVKAFLVTHPRDVERILVEKQRSYPKQTRGYRALRLILGNGMLTSEGSFWLRQRRLAQPAFHRERLKGFLELMTSSTEGMIDAWKPKLGGPAFDIAPEMMSLTLKIVCEALMSTDVGSHTGEVGEALSTILAECLHRTVSPLLLPLSVPSPRNRRFVRARAVLDGVVNELIAARRKQGEPYLGPGGRADLLSMLMSAKDEDTGEQMTDAQLRDEVMTLILAGHETTANALTWTLSLLSRHSDVERKLRAELAQVLGNGPVTLEALSRLTYLESVLKESMRLYPPVWSLARLVTEDDTLGGYRIPARSIVLMSPYITHRDPRFWPNPEGFDPDRWSQPDEHRPRYAYFPFSGGPRKCIGDVFAMMEAKVVLATLLPKVKLTLAPGETPHPEPLITLRVKGGARMHAAKA
jgi:cytochrome P450